MIEIKDQTKTGTPTFSPSRLLRPTSREAAVRAEVTLAVNIAMTTRPNMIQKMEKMRATIDFGDLSPYLVHEKHDFFQIYFFHLTSLTDQHNKQSNLNKFQYMKRFKILLVSFNVI